jgi:hypothetical protein
VKFPPRRLLDNLREGGLADPVVAQDYLQHRDVTTAIRGAVVSRSVNCWEISALLMC